MTTRRMILGSALTLPLGGAAVAQPAWPERPVRFVVAFAPGGFADLIGRMLGEYLGEIWRHPVVVENRGGAGGNVAAQQIARATADGYTALVTTGAFAINPSLSRAPGYRPEEFAVAGVVAGTPNLFVVRADSPVRTLRDLVELGKRRPINYGTAGVGVAAHLSAELLFKREGGVDAQHIPFTGAGPAMLALLAGTVDMVATSLPSAVSQVQGRQARGLAVTSATRNATMLDVPTVEEAGFAPIIDVAWVAVLYPAAVPPAVLARVNADINRVMALPAFQQRLAAAGFDPIGGNVEQARAYVAEEVRNWREVVRTIAIQID
ncbi:tripartite tricarboxylate transporter substrate binding protein [Roseomonas stagni]|uniref:Tripartite tricarboxylate transporter substrate binding protein n=1 Tax=Falsiroseomonas algicola TaxID=2716930 RepID=A0A6M1LH36_9PROT|nr:tripartite tricarboxylate transporter substrate-binding protein [Falsiroseomonas algicola]NGM19432.1 tripartite tricarboxylate transporter substrate binding protein [Falsiroseomonas algicola]